MIPKRLVKNQFDNAIRQINNVNNINLDWDSPSYYTGTVKRRPTSLDGGSDDVSPQDDDERCDKFIEIPTAKIDKPKSTSLPTKGSGLPRKIASKKGILKSPPYRYPPAPPSSSSSSSSSSSATSPPVDVKKPLLKKSVRIEDCNKLNHITTVAKEPKSVFAKRARRKTIFIQAEIKKLIQPENGRAEENNYILFNATTKMAVNNNHKMVANENESEAKDGECDILTKPEFSSDLFKNLPVRQRKGAVSHMENYCLFDPSVDFINEKELKLKMKQQQQMLIERTDNAINSLSIISVDEDDLIEEIIYEDQMVCDPLIHQDEYGDDELIINNDPSSNYFMVDPTLNSDFLRSSHSSPQLDNNPNKFTPTLPLPPTPKNKSYKTVPLESMNRNFTGTNSSGAISQRNSKLNTPLLRRNNTNLRKNLQRPLSNHSDADSGFLSPATPPHEHMARNNLDMEPRFNTAAFTVLEQCDSIQGYIEIYTDWANYYLDRAKSKKKVTDLSSDCKDGLLLAEVIEAVTTFKVPDLIKKPKTQQQMYDNVNSCLNTLRTHCVCGLDTITTAEICAGRLKAILALFFALSRYKQASKQQKHITSVSATTAANNKQLLLNSPPHHIPQPHPHLQYHQQQATSPPNLPTTGVNTITTIVDMTNRQLPAPYSTESGRNGGTSIPLPATVLVTRRSQPDKVRPLPPTPGQIAGLTKQNGSGGISSEDNSRPGSPPVNNHHVLSSQIPKGGGNNGLRQPPTGLKMPSSPYGNTNGNNNTMIPNGCVNSGTTTINSTTKHSMLEKLKLFNSSKDKSSAESKSKQNNITTASQISKRTSSSSGFSSARSERSDSSLSLNNDVNQIVSANQTANTKSNKANKESKSSSKSSSVSSKILSSSTKNNSKITTSSTNKTEKQNSKDKSPMRNTKPNSPQSISNSSSIQSLTKNESKMKMPAATSTPISSMKSGNGQKMNQMTPVNSTGIPKPMAAIKGTSKIPNDRHTIQKDDSMEFAKEQKILNNNNNNNHSSTTNNNNGNNNNNNISSEQIRQTNIVTPIQNAGNNISMTDSQNSTGVNSNSSESSVIYRPSSESGASDITNSSIGMNRTNNNNNNMKMMAATNQQRKFMEQMSNNDPLKMLNDQLNNQANKFNTVPCNSKVLPNTIYEEDHKNQMTIMPMRPILRGYTSHVTLPTRGLRGQHNMVADYYDDIGQGYCSDGDALRKTTIRYSDIDNGYLSEGGLSREGKHYLSILRGRTLLPTTIEERCRNSRGENLDSVGINTPPAMESNGVNHSSNQHRDSSRSRSERRGTTDQWSKYTDPHHHNHHNGHQTPPSPTSSNHSSGRSKEKGSPSHARRSTSTSKLSSTNGGSNSNISSSRNKTVPQNFGYIKQRSTNGGPPPIPNSESQQQLPPGRTVHVSAVQRSNKIKVSGGTQTCSSDLQSKVSQNPQHRSFSLTGPGATQLSQSIRERLSTGSHSLPKPGTEMHVFQHRFTQQQQRCSPKMIDGSLSDTQTYAEVKPDYSSYAMWLKHSNTATSRLSAESDGLENISIASSGGGGGGSGAGSSSSTGGIPRNLKFLQHRESTHSPRLNRSNSIRSTKSEKMYPSMLSRAPDMEIEPYYCLPVGALQQTTSVPWSQPTSPTPPSRGFGGLLSPTHGNYRLTYPKKNDDVHGSAASLLSGGSSLYGSVEERQANEMRRLKRELMDAKEQVMSLSSQLSTNAHVVAAFEQSLTSMTGRLQQLTANAEKKDSELTELRQTIERLRKSSIQAGLTSAHMQSMGVQSNNTQLMQNLGNNTDQHSSSSNNTNNQLNSNSNTTTGNGSMQRHHSTDSMCSLNSLSSGCSAQDKKKKKGWLRSSFTKAFSRNAKISKTTRHLNSGHHQSNSNNSNTNDSLINTTIQSVNNSTINESNLPPASPNKSPHKIVTLVENAKPVDAIDTENNPVVDELKKQLREKDLVLTDIRLEALSSASQLETLKDTVMRMRAEMMNLKQNNERLQKLVTSRSLAGSEVSLGAIGNSGSGGGGRDSSCGGSTSGGGPVSPNGSVNGEPRRFSLVDGLNRPPLELPKSLEETEEEDIPPAPAPDSLTSLSPTTHVDLTPPPKLDVHPVGEILSSTQVVEETGDTDGKRIAIAVYIGQPESFLRYAEEMNECDNYYVNTNLDNQDNLENGYDNNYHNHHHSQHYLHQQNPYEFIIAFTYISGKTTWQNLDYIVRKTFKDYLAKIDPGTNLGLNTDSITSYHLGEAKRGPEMGFPELLPCGYIVGNVRTLYICLQGVGSLAFDSLIPKNIVHRYISLLNEHRRLILCGPSGTGKSYLARKLAEFLVARSGRGNITEAIACFNVDHKSSKELRQYLTHIVEQASMANGVSELPSIIILDNLHHTSGDVFSCLTGPVQKLPCIIGIMSQATCNTTNLQLHHNFRWVLTANHMEPVKGFLGRFLRRRLYQLELSTSTPQSQLAAVFAWLPTVWQHINRFLETHSSSDVTIGPRLFLSCPLDIKDSQVWFTDVWNYHLAPYLVEAVREGVQLYGRRGGAWVDPSTYIKESYPWPQPPSAVAPLRHITAEDVGLESDPPDDNETQDPLLNMLLRLQEAANYADKDGQESDCASLDSNITQDSSAGAE